MSSYKCSLCNHVSNNKDNLKKHIAKVCGKEAKLIEEIVKLECDLCNKTFDTEKLLSQHKERCFKKRSIIITAYTDTNKVEAWMENTMKLIESLRMDNEKLANENKDLKKRIEKLEKDIVDQRENSKKSYVLLEEGNEELCVVDKFKQISPKDYEEVLMKVHPKIYEKNPNYGQPLNATCLTELGERLHCVCGDDIKITQSNGKEVRCAYGKVNIIYSFKSCKKECKYKVKKTGNCYCTDHYNEEIEEPVE